MFLSYTKKKGLSLRISPTPGYEFKYWYCGFLQSRVKQPKNRNRPTIFILYSLDSNISSKIEYGKFITVQSKVAKTDSRYLTSLADFLAFSKNQSHYPPRIMGYRTFQEK